MWYVHICSYMFIYVHICSMIMENHGKSWKIMENHGKLMFLVDQNCHSPLLDKPWTCCVENIARRDNVTYAPHLHVSAEILHCFLVLTLGASGKGSQHGVHESHRIRLWMIYQYVGDFLAAYFQHHGEYSLPISQMPCKKNNSLLVNVDIPIDTKRLVRISLYPCKIDLVVCFFFCGDMGVIWEGSVAKQTVCDKQHRRGQCVNNPSSWRKRWKRGRPYHLLNFHNMFFLLYYSKSLTFTEFFFLAQPPVLNLILRLKRKVHPLEDSLFLLYMCRNRSLCQNIDICCVAWHQKRVTSWPTLVHGYFLGLIWLMLRNNMGLSENRVYSQWNSHFS